MILEKHQKFIITGDSVTDCGRSYPVGEGNDGMGNGYAKYLHAMIDSEYPERHIRVQNTGISGNTSRDLRARFNEDVLSLSPGLISIMIGINDIWRQFDSPNHPEKHVYLDEYADNIVHMIEAALPVVKGILLVSPCYMVQTREDAMRAEADRYQQSLKEIAAEYRLPYVDAQKSMDRYFKHYSPMAMSWDAVHPNHVGHMIIAKEIMKTLEGSE